MEERSPEIQVLINTAVYLECQIEAVLQILADKGLKIDPEELKVRMHKIHTEGGEAKRYKIECRIKDPNSDIG